MKYPYIKAYGEYMGSFSYYVDAQIEKAEKDNAPHTAVYWSDKDNRWVEIQEMPDSPCRSHMYYSVGEMKGKTQ